MEKILKTKNYTLIFSYPDIIIHGSIDGNQFAYMDDAEEFARDFFSKDIKLKGHKYERDLTNAKKWLFGTLYHERKNSANEVMKITGYRSMSTVYTAIRSSGPLRSRKEGTEIAFQKKHGKSLSEGMKDIMDGKSDHMKKVMKDIWKERNEPTKNKIINALFDGRRRRWEEWREEKERREVLAET